MSLSPPQVFGQSARHTEDIGQTIYAVSCKYLYLLCDFMKKTDVVEQDYRVEIEEVN